ncbi:MAG: calcium/sodium antiporter [Archaeoglobaceae archaeon]
MELEVIISFAVFFVGIGFVVKGSDLFVAAATRVAKGLGVSEFIIALVLASIATTLPEITTSVIASFYGNSGIALGNAVGSVLVNIALILGLCALIMPLKVDDVAWKNSIFLAFTTLYAWILMLDFEISRLEGFTLVLVYLLYLYYLYKKHVSFGRFEPQGKVKRDVLLLFGSGLFIVFGARIVVSSAVEIAANFGVSEAVIGLTLVAIGTSLPELANSLVATLKKVHNISVGNIIGACIINVLVVIGLASLVKPISVDPGIFSFSTPLAILLTIILTISLKKDNIVGRKTATTFLVLYAIFIYLQI